MKVILCGYHWTGCKALEILLEEGHEVYVYTHRTENYIADMAGLCLKRNVSFTTDKIQVDNLPFVPDIICSVYYRYIIGKEVIEKAKGKIFNLHPALLPQYRGCSSLTWAIINGEEKCGFTYHYIDEGCDTGNIILQKEIEIEDFDTQLTLYNRVMFESLKYFSQAFLLVSEGYMGKKQEGKASQYKRGCPYGGEITDSMDEAMKERFIRAMCYPPYPPARYNGSEVKTFQELQKIREGGGKIILLGCGGHARSIVASIKEINSDIVIYLLDKEAQPKEKILGCDVVKSYRIRKNDSYMIAIGNNQRRKEAFLHLKREGKGTPLSIVSPNAVVGMHAEIGEGTFIAANVYIGPQVKIGSNTVINTASNVEHETIIGNHVHIAPNATICGRAQIGNTVFCGAGSTVIDKVHICDDVVIGAGAVVLQDISVPGTYAGVPAKRIS